MQALAAFHLWPRLHQDLLRFVDLVPEEGLAWAPPGEGGTLGRVLGHVAEVEDYWRRIVLADPSPDPPEAPAAGRAALRGRLEEVFAATERLLASARLDALAARPVATRYPARNALEALALCHLHTVHHRAQAAATLRAHGLDPGEWI